MVCKKAKAVMSGFISLKGKTRSGKSICKTTFKPSALASSAIRTERATFCFCLINAPRVVLDASSFRKPSSMVKNTVLETLGAGALSTGAISAFGAISRFSSSGLPTVGL